MLSAVYSCIIFLKEKQISWQQAFLVVFHTKLIIDHTFIIYIMNDNLYHELPLLMLEEMTINQWLIVVNNCRYLYAVGNSLIRKFWYLNLTVKLKLFKIYCGDGYSGQLWSNYSAACISKVTTAYNTILRRLLNIPRFQDGVSYSASAMFTS